jgi:hypothetical protein
VYRFGMRRSRLQALAFGSLLIAGACGSDDSSGAAKSLPAFGEACTCENASPTADWMCKHEDGPCAGALFCVNGLCTELCGSDPSVCPPGSVCTPTTKSNLTEYCAPQNDGG